MKQFYSSEPNYFMYIYNVNISMFNIISIYHDFIGNFESSYSTEYYKNYQSITVKIYS